ncbi:hypothetical protein ACRAWD_06555 [Caulobacter segnis]
MVRTRCRQACRHPISEAKPQGLELEGIVHVILAVMPIGHIWVKMSIIRTISGHFVAAQVRVFRVWMSSALIAGIVEIVEETERSTIFKIFNKNNCAFWRSTRAQREFILRRAKG